ncbi:unnamed protein product [Toxocara canis]|uniref:DDE-1 domain-containing protein n=1 Tax=Toxocara canis TaxID=6265 RepID=A0A183U337_TOXCA|nr:unnamed protein product [Toxocara canis]
MDQLPMAIKWKKEMSASKTCGHADHAEGHVIAVDIFTSKKFEHIWASTHNMKAPVVDYKEFQISRLSNFIPRITYQLM